MYLKADRISHNIVINENRKALYILAKLNGKNIKVKL